MHILITGASSGIGLATAELLINKGHKLSLCSRNIDKLDHLASSAFLGRCDVRNYDEVSAFVRSSEEANGPVDVLLNNAGLGKFNPAHEASIEEWHEMVDTNVKGVLNVIHAVLPTMKKQESGHIINLGSVASHNVFPNSGIYCATKHAVLAISESLRLDCSSFLKVTTISPGAVNTNFIYQTDNKDLLDKMEGSFLDGMTPPMIAEQIVYAIEYADKAVISEILIRPNKLKS